MGGKGPVCLEQLCRLLACSGTAGQGNGRESWGQVETWTIGELALFLKWAHVGLSQEP